MQAHARGARVRATSATARSRGARVRATCSATGLSGSAAARMEEAARLMQAHARGARVRAYSGSVGLPGGGARPLMGKLASGQSFFRKASLPRNIPSLSPQEQQLVRACEDGDSEELLRLLSGRSSRDNSSQQQGGAPVHINVKIPDTGQTPLMLAAEGNHATCALLLMQRGAKLEARDERGKTALAYAVARGNTILAVAMVAAACGLSGNSQRRVANFLSRKDATELYALLATLDSVKCGRVAALLFLVSPASALVALLRASVALRDKALLVSRRDPDRANHLTTAARGLEMSVGGLLSHIEVLIVPITPQQQLLQQQARESRGAQTQPSSPEGAAAGVTRRPSSLSRQSRHSQFSSQSRQNQFSKRELIAALLRDSQSAIDVAVRYACKEVLAHPFIMNYIEDRWASNLIQQSAAAAKRVDEPVKVRTHEQVKSARESGEEGNRKLSRRMSRAAGGNANNRKSVAAPSPPQQPARTTSISRSPAAVAAANSGKAGVLRRAGSSVAFSSDNLQETSSTGGMGSGNGHRDSGKRLRHSSRRLSLSNLHAHLPHMPHLNAHMPHLDLHAHMPHLDVHAHMPHLDLQAHMPHLELGEGGMSLVLKFVVGSRVLHAEHGEGSVVEHHAHGASFTVEFDAGEVETFSVANLGELTRLTDSAKEAAGEENSLGLVDLLLAAPRFAVQGVILWLPLAVYPPLAPLLRKHAGNSYLLEVPCLKFLASFTNDLLFFISFTALSQPRFYPGAAYAGAYGHESFVNDWLVPVHLMWVSSILLNELGESLSSREAAAQDLWTLLVETCRGGTRAWLSGTWFKPILAILNTFITPEDMVELYDIWGPLLAFISLLEGTLDAHTCNDAAGWWSSSSSGKGQGRELEARELALRREGCDDMEANYVRQVTHGFALMLLGWRIMRLLMINSSMGPMVLMLNMMLFDVAVWLCVQIVFMLGVASAIYSLVGSPDVTSTGVHTDACELLWISDYQTREGPLRTWFRALMLLIESTLTQEADLACVRRWSAYPTSMSLILAIFQLVSAILMLNMLIALMAKTFDQINEKATVNCNFLRAQVIMTWVDHHPSPPPFNLIGMPIRLLVAILAGARRTCHQLHLRCSKGGRGRSRGTWSYSGQETHTRSRRGSSDSMAAGARTLYAATGCPERFALIADYRDEQHVRRVAKLVAKHVAEATGETRDPVEDLSSKVERMEAQLGKVCLHQAEAAQSTDALVAGMRELMKRLEQAQATAVPQAQPQAAATPARRCSDDTAAAHELQLGNSFLQEANAIAAAQASGGATPIPPRHGQPLHPPPPQTPHQPESFLGSIHAPNLSLSAMRDCSWFASSVGGSTPAPDHAESSWWEFSGGHPTPPRKPAHTPPVVKRGAPPASPLIRRWREGVIGVADSAAELLRI